MTKQDDELKEKLETITKSYACTQVFYDEASEVDYPKMLEAIEALIKEQERQAELEAYKRGVRDGWNKSSEGYNAEYGGRSSRTPDEVEQEVVDECIAQLEQEEK